MSQKIKFYGFPRPWQKYSEKTIITVRVGVLVKVMQSYFRVDVFFGDTLPCRALFRD